MNGNGVIKLGNNGMIVLKGKILRSRSLSNNRHLKKKESYESAGFPTTMVTECSEGTPMLYHR